MIALLLDYPVNIDVFGFNLPVPENISTKKICLLTFKDGEEYQAYVNTICDIIDELEYSSFYKHNAKNAEKLKFCRLYISYLVDHFKNPLPETI